jgi:hypothetical protein
MTTVTMRPNATNYAGVWSVTGAASRHAATSDNSDSSYISPAAGDWLCVLDLTTPTIPALAQIRSVSVRLRRLGDSNSSMDVAIGYQPATGGAYQSQIIAKGDRPTSTLATKTYGSTVKAPGGVAWTPQILSLLQIGFGSVGSAIRIHEVYVDVVYDSAPSVVITAPVGTVRGSQLPVIVGAYSDPENSPCERIHGKIFTSTVASAAGFSPYTSTAVFDSEEQLSTVAQVGVDFPLPAGSYVAALRAADAGSGGRFGQWALATFTMGGELPATPTVTITPEDDLRRVALTAVQTDNLLSYDQSVVGDGWVPADSNTAITSTPTTAPPTSGGGLGLLDSFTGANGALTAANSDLDWTIDSGTWAVTSNTLTSSSGGGSATTPPSTLRSATQVLNSSDHYVQLQITALPSTTAANVWLRMSAAHTGYMIQVTGWGQFIVERWAGSGNKFPISGGFQNLPKTLVLPATLRGEIQGSRIRVYVQGANDSASLLLGEYIDTTITSGVQPGLGLYNALSTAIVDNFAAGELAQVVIGGSDSGTVLGAVALTAARPGGITTGGPGGASTPIIGGETVTVRAAGWQTANAARSLLLDAEFDGLSGPLVNATFTDLWAGTAGAAWNTGNWTSNHQTGASDSIASGGGGQLTTGVTANTTPAREYASGMTAIRDAEILVQVNLSNVADTQARIGLRSNGTFNGTTGPGPATGYFVAIDGANNAVIVRNAPTTALNGASGQSFTPKAAGTWLRFRVRDLTTLGVTLIQAKWWDVGADEPTPWNFSGTDTTWFNTTGKVALSASQTTANARTVTYRTLTVDTLSNHSFGTPWTSNTDGSLAGQARNVVTPGAAVGVRLYATGIPTGAGESFVWAAAGVLPGAGRAWSRGGLTVPNLHTDDEARGATGWTPSANATISTVTQLAAWAGTALQLAWNSGAQDIVYATGPGKPASPAALYAVAARLGRFTGVAYEALGLEFRDVTGAVLGRSFANPVVPVAGATALLATSQVAIAPDRTATVHACLASSAAAPAAQITQVVVVPGSTLPVTFQPGPAAAGYARAESSDDGGQTWQLIRGTTGMLFGPARTVTVYDNEAPTGSDRLWRVSTAGVDYELDPDGGALVVSLPAGPLMTTLATPGWWLRDPLTPSRLLPVHIPDDLNYSSDDPQEVYSPLGRRTPIIVTDVVKSEVFALTFLFQTEIDWLKFEEIRGAGVPLLFAGPSGRQWFVRLGATRKAKLLRSADQTNAPIRTVTISATEVDRPDPSIDLADLVTDLVWETV